MILFVCLLPFQSIHQLRENVFQEHRSLKEKELESGPQASHGYGGKFGVEQDRMDKVNFKELGWLLLLGIGYVEFSYCPTS